VLNVAGQTRLHEAFWLAQLAKHASELSAVRNFLTSNVRAEVSPTVESKTSTVNSNFIATSIYCRGTITEIYYRSKIILWRGCPERSLIPSINWQRLLATQGQKVPAINRE
jgi:hypothetical protein